VAICPNRRRRRTDNRLDRRQACLWRHVSPPRVEMSSWASPLTHGAGPEGLRVAVPTSRCRAVQTRMVTPRAGSQQRGVRVRHSTYS
jgi:hypothetical protein